MSVAGFKEKIEQNVIDSDGTVIISHRKLSGGADHAQKVAKKHERPCLHMDLNETPVFIASSKINSWIIENDIEVMNITCSRASEDSDVYRDTVYIIEGVILHINENPVFDLNFTIDLNKLKTIIAGLSKNDLLEKFDPFRITARL